MSVGTPKNFDSLKSVHVIGVCGTLMGAFAAFLKRRGVAVTGSDENVYPPMSDVLRNAGVQLMSGYRPENLTMGGSKPEMIVIGNVISRGNPEAEAALKSGIPYVSLPEFMERLMLPKTRNLVVAGTHGKTTTSSMLAHVLSTAGKNPSYFIGGVSQDLPHSFHVSSLDKGNCFVLEGDEYDTAFWDKVPKFNHYLPDEVILTSVEYDHADIYPSFEAVLRAFEGLLDRIRPGGRLIACMDYPVMSKLLERAKVPVITYGSHAVTAAQWVPGPVRMNGDKMQFEVLENEKPVGDIELQLSGTHNVLNALAVWIQCRKLGLSSAEVRAALASFRGVKRRQEVRGEVQGVTVIDDFAHHPTAVRETLKGLKSRYPGRRLVAVFEPRSATSRRKVFQNDYVKAFLESDSIYISTPYDQTKIPQEERFSTEELVEGLKRKGRTAEAFGPVEEGVSRVASACRKGDVVAVLSNGGFGGFISKLLGALERPV
jgi:UDP-N-acetylmuramate: L-alanyl-gamma-D-glutamyl-meso-diaminopimelate ligase